jgi:G protein-coupled receptor Mth (Methuselah protein)
LRICNFENADKVFILSGLLNNKKPTSSDFLVDQLPGYLSFILTLISTTLMIACLFTYALFSELRNIPGWTIINLTLAMSIAQVSFLASSYFGTTTPTLCFINSLSIHYGYLASFFWMNVIAFDLYRNFRDKASHVLIHSVTLKSRLPKYALYGWLAPMIVVATAVILDLSMMNISSPYRPCYAGFLPGCVIRT